MEKKKGGEIRFFLSQPLNIRVLLITNLLFAMILPLIEVFAGAYIMRNTGGAATAVVIYQLCMYVGVVLSAVINGVLLKKFKVATLYSFGILVSAISLVVMMFIHNVTLTMICTTGMMLGLSTGFFWTNRYLLTLYSTDDDNRNYFFGFESFFFSLWGIVIPLAVGTFLHFIEGKEAFGRILETNNGYQCATIVALLISIVACFVLSKGDFKKPENKNFFHIKYHPLWYKLLSLSALKGMVQGFLVTAPAILTLKLVGDEGSLGLIQGIGGAVTAIIVYVLGRIAKPQHRMPIFGFGLFVFFAGAVVNCAMFSAMGVIIFIACKVLFQPLHDLAYFPTMMKTIDAVSTIEKRDGYTYILSHEVGMFVGRAFGMVLFIVIATLVNENAALRYALLIVAAIQLLSLPLAKHIVKSIDNNGDNVRRSTIIVCLAILAAACGIAFSGNKYGEKVEQVNISRVDKMANFPQPYNILDWHQKALDFDAYAFDFNTTLPAGPAIWLDNAQRNLPQTTFGIYTAMNDDRQGPDRNNGEFHESLNTLHCLISAGLNGIDKTNQDGYNYVKMVQNYFNTENGWNIVMNNTCPDVALLGGGYGRDWWYDVYPNILYYAVCEIFPGVEYSDHIQRTVADQFEKADSVLNGNYDHSYFDYAAMEGKDNWIPFQQDAAGGHGWVLYAAYQKYGEERYLEHAKSAIAALDSQTESRFYEILLPMGIYTAARLNAEQGCNYDIAKMFDWVFDGCTNPVHSRTGWGITAGKWGDYEISGLQGSLIDGGGFAFLMNSIDVAWPFVPLVKYQPQYARAIGKWMLNNTNSCRLFYPDQLPDDHQTLPGMQSYTNSVIAYEGLRYEMDDYYTAPERQAEYNLPADIKEKHPVAIGDGPKWYPTNPKQSMFSTYSSSAAGILGAIVEKTDVDGILRFNCNATDFYASKPYPVYLMFNPFDSSKRVIYNAGEGRKDVFDIVSKSYLAKNVEGQAKIKIPADGAVIAVEIPAGSKIVKEEDGSLTVDGNIISFK